jgi:hypothetical protein
VIQGAFVYPATLTATAVAARRLSKSSPPTYPRKLRRRAAQEHGKSAEICVNLRMIYRGRVGRRLTIIRSAWAASPLWQEEAGPRRQQK